MWLRKVVKWSHDASVWSFSMLVIKSLVVCLDRCIQFNFTHYHNRNPMPLLKQDRNFVFTIIFNNLVVISTWIIAGTSKLVPDHSLIVLQTIICDFQSCRQIMFVIVKNKYDSMLIAISYINYQLITTFPRLLTVVSCMFSCCPKIIQNLQLVCIDSLKPVKWEAVTILSTCWSCGVSSARCYHAWLWV